MVIAFSVPKAYVRNMDKAQHAITELQKMIDESKAVVFFGGAGVSTESGIPDFRSVDGLYRQQWKYPPETIISRSFFDSNPQEFFRFYRAKLLTKGIKPNAAHYKLAELESKGKLIAVVTQNIDGLHQAAGSKNVFELHGSVLRNYCMKCGAFYTQEEAFCTEGVPICTKTLGCKGIIKPDVVLYEEGLDQAVIEGAVHAIERADMLIIGGTSLSVYPAAGLIRYFHGAHSVLINKTETAGDSSAELVIHDSIGAVLSQLSAG